VKVRGARVLPRGPLLAGPADVRVARWFLVRWIVDVIAPHRPAEENDLGVRDYPAPRGKPRVRARHV